MTRKNRRGTASLSARIPPELRTFLKEMARDRGISEAASVCVLIEKEMGKPSRRPNKQNLMWSEELAKIHKAIIACGKQVNSNRCDRSD